MATLQQVATKHGLLDFSLFFWFFMPYIATLLLKLDSMSDHKKARPFSTQQKILKRATHNPRFIICSTKKKLYNVPV